MARRLRARQHRRPPWVQALLLIGISLAVVLASGVVAAQLLLDRWEGAIDQDELVAPEARDPSPPTEPTAPGRPGAPGGAAPGGAEPGRAGGASTEGPLTYLVVGTDRHARHPQGAGLADAIVIVHLAAGLREGYLVSVPRDLRVNIPGHGMDKINAAYRFGGGGSGGAQLLSRTLTELTGVGFDGAAILDFPGFETVIDELGGVEICLDRPVRSIHTGAVFDAECQHLSGREALDLARQRYDLPAGDFDRGRNHQQLIQAMMEQARSAGVLTNPLQLDRTIRAVGDAVTVDTGGVPLPELALGLRHLRADELTGITLPSYPQQLDGISYVLADPAADGLYRALRNSEVDEWADDHPRWRND